MWRTVLITKGGRISTRDNQLIIKTHEYENVIPLEDIYSIVIESLRTEFTANAVNALTTAGVHIIICNDKHLPNSLALPLNTHYRAYNVLKKQIELPKEIKSVLWKEIIKSKIINQKRVLQFTGKSKNVMNKLMQFSQEVLNDDTSNREGLSAKMFFRELYGSEFVRMADDSINSALNYGYAILRSAVSKSLVAYGFNCALGIHHINEYNAFNLSDDFMEPYRPIVDFWVDTNRTDLCGNLTMDNKLGLINLINQCVLCDGKRVKVRYSIDLLVKSLVSCIENGVADGLLLPEIIPFDQG